MMKKQELHDSFYQVMDAELAAMRLAANMMYTDLPYIVEAIVKTEGKVVFVGVGKSGLILRKAAATFNSLRIPAHFLHAGEMLHGDLGAVEKEDVIIMASKSGTSAEVVAVLDALVGNTVIGITEFKDSPLGKRSAYHVIMPRSKEADEFNIVPTSSTTVQLAICDALALTVVRNMTTTKEDFAAAHPGGSLGQKLNVKVGAIMKEASHEIHRGSSIKDVVLSISAGRMGACVVVEDDKAVGIITDGDLRRMLEKEWDENVSAENIMSRDPKVIKPELPIGVAIDIMEGERITQLVVVENGVFIGLIHLHDCLSCKL